MINKTFYKRNLPHIQPIGGTFFVTCSLKGAIPKQSLYHLKERNQKESNLPETTKEINFKKYQARRKYVQNMEKLLHKNSGPTFLEAPEIARILLARVESYHMRYYKLIAISIMPNHFHILLDTSVQIKGILEPETVPQGYVQLNKIMQLIKGGSARYINQWLGTEGKQVWENESFDVYIKNERMLRRVITYILDNPVKAGIVERYEDHPFTFVNEI